MNFSQDYYEGDETVWVPVAWLLKNITGSVDFDDVDFVYWMLEKCSDTGFGHLVESIIQYGFREEGAIGFFDGKITEGHHRLCAAILLCLDVVPISAYGNTPQKGVAAGISAHWSHSDPYPIEVELH